MRTEDLILIGRVSKPHGIRGMLNLISYAESIDTFYDIDSLYLKKKDGSFTAEQIAAISPHKNGAIVGFASAKDIQSAKALVGCELYIDKGDLEELPAGEYYRHELIGLEVITDKGIVLGKIEEVMETGSNDVFVVRKGDIENLIPATKEVIRDIDIEKGTMTVRPLDKMIKGL